MSEQKREYGKTQSAMSVVKKEFFDAEVAPTINDNITSMSKAWDFCEFVEGYVPQCVLDELERQSDISANRIAELEAWNKALQAQKVRLITTEPDLAMVRKDALGEAELYHDSRVNAALEEIGELVALNMDTSHMEALEKHHRRSARGIRALKANTKP